MDLCVSPRFLYCPGSISFSPKPAYCTDTVSLLWYLIKTAYTYPSVTVPASSPTEVYSVSDSFRGKLPVRLDYKVSHWEYPKFSKCHKYAMYVGHKKKLSMTSICGIAMVIWRETIGVKPELINWYRSMDVNSREAALQQSWSEEPT